MEHVHVISGEVSVHFDHKWHALKAGESIRFFSDQPYGYQAESEIAVFHNIVCYPK
ncbi:cupin domain-containing protein [Vibrio panuliri]|uniref:cupin domain-containing protein n=1 Tax=Vibrio panuliri TaxID=1381081 RepID=UPI001115248F|nr:cupin domain-containing protein [Vibrio panuliri]